jgi:hypothetical protein
MHPLTRDRGNDLVRIHVRRGPRARLEHVNRELVVVLALGYRVARGGDPVCQVTVEQTELGVGSRGGRLDAAQPADDRHGHVLARHREVVDGLARLAAPERFVGHAGT